MLMRHGHTPPPRERGFTLIELMVTVSLFALLMAMAIPAFSDWIANARVRTVANALQDGIRTAQNEAVRRSRPTVFALTNDTPSATATASANGKQWAVFVVPKATDTGNATDKFIQGGTVADTSGGVTVTGPAQVCFNSMGRQAPILSPGVTGATCAAPADALLTYDVARSTGSSSTDRALRVTVSLSGQVRMCDPAKSQSTSPDGCP